MSQKSPKKDDLRNPKEAKSISKKRGRAVSVLKKTAKDFGKDFSEGAEKLADICVEISDRSAESEGRGKKLAKETYFVFRKMALNAKENLKNFKLKRAIYDTFYQMGNLLRRSKNKSIKIFNELKNSQ